VKSAVAALLSPIPETTTYPSIGNLNTTQIDELTEWVTQYVTPYRFGPELTCKFLINLDKILGKPCETIFWSRTS